MKSEGVGTHVTDIGSGILANLACSLASAGCVALGLAHSPDMNDPKNWASWAALLVIFGGVAFVGTGANGARLWLKKRIIGRSSGERLTIILADLDGDDSSKSQKQNVGDALERYLESSVHIIAYPEVLVIGEGDRDAQLANSHARAQELLKDKRGDLLIWGRVKSTNALALYFTARSAETSRISSYGLVSDEECALELPVNFDRDLGAAVASRVVAVGNALVGRQGSFLTPYAEHFAKQIAPLVAHPKANWSPDARGELLSAFGLAKALAGQEQADSSSLNEAIAAYREALKEWTQARVPLKWAATQNDLGAALMRLGERESGKAKLEEAVAAYREALKERTQAYVPLHWAETQNNLGAALMRLAHWDTGTAKLEEAVTAYREALKEYTQAFEPLGWAATQNNLGNALSRLGEQETGTAKLEEAVAAYRKALEEYTQAREPLDWAATQNNLGSALMRLGEREGGRAKLQEAVAAYREALKERTRKRVPLGWAATQNNLGNALSRLGEWETGTAKLEEAVAAYREALKEYTPAHAPRQWEMTQGNLRTALLMLRMRESGMAQL